jgi:primosomal protein N' (replication factor Y)
MAKPDASTLTDLFDEDSDGLAVRSVLTTAPIAGPLSYLVAADMPPGALVETPLGGRTVVGVIWDQDAADKLQDFPREKLKAVGQRLDAPLLPPALRQLIDWTARYVMAPPGAVLRMALPRAALAPPPKRTLYRPPLDGPNLEARMTPARRRALDALEDAPALPAMEAARVGNVSPAVVKGMASVGLLEAVEVIGDAPAPVLEPTGRKPVLGGAQAEAVEKLEESARSGAFSVTLLDGVTGSGKTVVYMEAMAATLAAGRQALCLLPEIALTDQWLDRFQDRFGARPLVWHSELSSAERRRAWRAIGTGEAGVVVGARSSLYLPFPRLGLIVVDEEHDGAFKQEDGVRYHARDMAVVRGQLEDAAVILASATPSLETLANVDRGRYTRLALPHRHGGAQKPDIGLIDLRSQPPERGRWLSRPLVDAIDVALEAGKQSLLFLNRRGYAPLTLCRACGERLECPHCSAWLVEHRLHGRLICHHCGYSARPPSNCPACDAEDKFAPSGPGVERVAEEAMQRWPEARVEVASSDTLAAPHAIRDFTERMAAGEIDIAIGTQVLAKGHHFPELTVVGIVDGDLGLGGGDLRAAERTYQLLTQAAGRAGRADSPGFALIQTHQPEHPVMQAIAASDRDAFVTAESAARQMAGLPPHGRLAALIVTGKDLAATERLARAIARAAPRWEGVRVLGPAPAPLAQLRGRWRFRLLMQGRRDTPMQAYLKEWLDPIEVKGGARLHIDVDPYSFL